MMKHTRKAMLALVAVALLVGAGNAWGATLIGPGSYNVNTDDTSPRSADNLLQNNLILQNHSTPAGELQAANVTVNTNVLLWNAGSSSTPGTVYYINNQFDTPIELSSPVTEGAIDLKGYNTPAGLIFQPTFHRWRYVDSYIPIDQVQTVAHHIGTTGDVLRIYDSTLAASGVLTIDTSDNYGYAGYTGGTYLESGTLIAAAGSTFPFGPVGTHPSGSVTLGAFGVDTKNANLKILATGVVIPELRVRNANETLEVGTIANGGTTIHKLIMENPANAFDLTIPGTWVVSIDQAYDNQVSSSNTATFKIMGTGTLNFAACPIDYRTNIDIGTNGAIVRTSAPGDQAFGHVTAGVNNNGKLVAEGALGTLTITTLSGNPIIYIPSYYETVSVPAGSYIADVAGPGGAAPLNAMESNGTLQVRAGGTPPNVYLRATTTTGTPRLDIQAGMTLNDACTNSPRQYNGINGPGALVLPNSVTALNLTPVIDSNFTNNLQGSITTVTLTADDLDTVQRFGGTTSNVSSYTVAQGTLEFGSVAAIKSTGGATTLNVTGGTDSGLKFDYVNGGYGLTSNPAATLNVTAADSTIWMTPSSSNTNSSEANITSTPATLRFANVTGSPAPLNIRLDATNLSTTGDNTARFVGLISSDAVLTAPWNSPNSYNVILDPAGSATSVDTTVKIFDNYVYIGYLKPSAGGGGGGDPDPTPIVVSLDMTPILNAVKSDDIFIINWVRGTTDHYNLKNRNLRINAGEEDVAGISQKDSTIVVTYNFSPVYSGAPVIITLKDAAGNTSTYNATSKIIDGHSILDFSVAGLASGTYTLSLSSPAGSNPFYVGPIGSFTYTAPAGAPVFTLTAGKAGESGVTAYATLMQDGSPLAGVDVTFLITNSAGALIGTGQTKATGADGKTPAVSFAGLAGGTYTVTATSGSYGSRASNVTIAGDTSNESMIVVESTSPAHPKAGDTVTVRGSLDTLRYDPQTLKAYLSDADIDFRLDVESNGRYTLTFTMPDHDISYYFTAEAKAGGTLYQSKTFPLSVYVPTPDDDRDYGDDDGGSSGCDGGFAGLALLPAIFLRCRKRS